MAKETKTKISSIYIHNKPEHNQKKGWDGIMKKIRWLEVKIKQLIALIPLIILATFCLTIVITLTIYQKIRWWKE